MTCSGVVVTCSFSIHCTDKQSQELKAAVDSFPIPVAGSAQAYHCGYSSEASFGSTSYLLVREGGNVLVDSPRFDAKLLKRIQVGCQSTSGFVEFRPLQPCCSCSLQGALFARSDQTYVCWHLRLLSNASHPSLFLVKLTTWPCCLGSICVSLKGTGPLLA